MDLNTFLMMSGETVFSTQLAKPLAVDGRFFVNAQNRLEVVRLLLVSQLSILRRTTDERAALYKEMKRLGFMGFRVFCGDLGWAGQTPSKARSILPIVLAEAELQGLYVYVCAITGGKDPVYDIRDHLGKIVDICSGFPNVLLEGANEIGHPTLSEQATVPWLNSQLSTLCPAGMLWTPGAPVSTDEPTPDHTWVADGGIFNDSHLDRGRDKWNQVRRLRELYAIVECTGNPQMNGEMIGADEKMGGSTGAKQRRNDPDFFFAAGVLSRGFELQTLFHSQAGLESVLMGPVQTECAKEFIRGFRCIPTEDRLSFINAGWAGSPVSDWDEDGTTRCYSFTVGNHGWTVILGSRRDPAIVWGGGWQPVGEVTRTESADGKTIVMAIAK